MAHALTFGVEFEFRLLTIEKTSSGFPLVPANETRTLVFEPTVPDISVTGSQYKVPESIIHQHVAETIHKAGLPINPGELFLGNVSKWEVTHDGSINNQDIKHDGFTFKVYPIEVTTPAYYMCQDALDAVVQVCKTLRATYVIDTDHESCGLHIHVGNNSSSFTFTHIRNLLAFLFAFEPQLNSLHPPHRQHLSEQDNGTFWFASYRKSRHWLGDGYEPTPLEGVSKLLRAKDWKVLYDLTEVRNKAAYNMKNIFKGVVSEHGHGNLLEGSYPDKRTVEFRQHMSTLDGDLVTAWIRTVVGMVEFTRDAHPKAFGDLLAIVEHEKLSPGEEEKILAEDDFTVVDLLKHMKLWSPAKYYKRRGIFYKYRPQPCDSVKNQCAQQ